MKATSVFLRTSVAAAALLMAAGSFAQDVLEPQPEVEPVPAAVTRKAPARRKVAPKRRAAKPDTRAPESTENFTNNALARCQRLEGRDRQACEQRIQGDGRRTGSVAEGGILRELEVREVQPAPAAPAPATAPAPVPAPAPAQ